MVWNKTDIDGKPRFIRRDGKNIILTREKRGNLLEDVPEGWSVDRLPNGRLKLRSS